jgi:hypothetical protein
MRFKFFDGQGPSGYLAFTTFIRDTGPLLLVTDAGHDAVHVIDIIRKTHEGYLAPPGSIAGPRGVAASGVSPLVAISAWKHFYDDDHVVILYKGDGAVWKTVRVIGGELGCLRSPNGQLGAPHGLRFNRDGSVICVAEENKNRASLFRVADGGFVRHMVTGLRGPMDVEEVEGGWLVACMGSRIVQFEGGDGDVGGRHFVGKAGSGDGEFNFPNALAIVPGLGLAVLESASCRLQVFATPDVIAMWTNMSGIRVAWMTAVSRGIM